MKTFQMWLRSRYATGPRDLDWFTIKDLSDYLQEAGVGPSPPDPEPLGDLPDRRGIVDRFPSNSRVMVNGRPGVVVISGEGPEYGPYLNVNFDDDTALWRKVYGGELYLVEAEKPPCDHRHLYLKTGESHPRCTACHELMTDIMVSEVSIDSPPKTPEAEVTEEKLLRNEMIIAALDVVGWNKVAGRELYAAYLAMKALEPKRPVEITPKMIERALNAWSSKRAGEVVWYPDAMREMRAALQAALEGEG